MSLHIVIQNDGTGTPETGSYTYRVYVNTNLVDSGQVQGHRRAMPWWVLAERVANDAAYYDMVRRSMDEDA